ncbi:hypothetical protein DL768_003157 [Monosporascus sp. mg162]|nr:hypothetical protein DL768_003157 [Monosporascus sp. mg162]
MPSVISLETAVPDAVSLLRINSFLTNLSSLLSSKRVAFQFRHPVHFTATTTTNRIRNRGQTTPRTATTVASLTEIKDAVILIDRILEADLTIRDIRGYLLLAWSSAVADPVPEGFSYASLYGERAKTLGIQHFDDFAKFRRNANLRMQLGAHIFQNAEFPWEGDEDGGEDESDVLAELADEEPEEDDDDVQLERHLRAVEADADQEEVPQEHIHDEIDVLSGRAAEPGLTAEGAARRRRQKM